MDDKEIKKEETLERIIGLLEHGKELSEDELAQLMPDEEAMRACKDLMDCKSAVMQEYASSTPDMEREWQRFQEKRMRKPKRHFFWGAVSGIAASLLIFVIYSWWSGEFVPEDEFLAFQAIDDPQQVVLQTGAGSLIALEENTSKEELEAAGMALDKVDTLELKYLAQKAGKVETHVLTTPRGHDFRVVLADGTVVWLNAESRLEYPSQFTGKERVVRLQGEAYFKVAKDAGHPFIIQTKHMRARVLGTELNIRDYVADDSHVTLIEGSVEVAGGQANNYTRLKPGEDAQLKADGSFAVQEVDVDAYTYWREGYFYFDNVPLIDVMQSLGRWHNLNVVFHNKKVMNYRMHYFCNRSDTPEQAITLLNRMKKVNVKLVDNTVYIE